MKRLGSRWRPLALIVVRDPSRRRGEAPSRCPACGGPTIVPVVYGYPSPEMFEAATHDEIILGGCIAYPESPTWECADCGSKEMDDPSG